MIIYDGFAFASFLFFLPAAAVMALSTFAFCFEVERAEAFSRTLEEVYIKEWGTVYRSSLDVQVLIFSHEMRNFKAQDSIQSPIEFPIK